MLVHMVVPLTPGLQALIVDGLVNEVLGVHVSCVVSVFEEFRESATVDLERPFCIMIQWVTEWVLRMVASGDKIGVVMDDMLSRFVKIVVHCSTLFYCDYPGGGRVE